MSQYSHAKPLVREEDHQWSHKRPSWHCSGLSELQVRYLAHEIARPELATLLERDIAAQPRSLSCTLDSFASEPAAPGKDCSERLEWILAGWREAPTPYLLSSHELGEFRPNLYYSSRLHVVGR